MAANRFSLYDFFVDIVPGAAALLIFFSLLPAQYDVLRVMSNTSLLSGVAFLIVSYVLGHLVQAIASPVDRRFTAWEPWIAESSGLPYPFEYRLNNPGSTNAPAVTKAVKNELDGFFDSALSGYELFFATQSYLWHNDIGRMKRFQRLYTHFRGIYVLLCIGGILHLLGLVLSIANIYQSIWTRSELGILGVSLVGLAGIIYWRRVRFHKEMAKAMIFDFYSNVLSQDD